MTLGFEMAGFHSIGAVELDKHAARSHALNFMSHLQGEAFERHACPKDITITEPEELLSMLGFTGRVDEHVDIVVGGPPCQAFARVGRAKLREIADHPEAFLKDPRGNLYLRYLHYVSKLKPLAIVMENVPDVLNYGGHNIAEETCEILDSWGYACGYSLLNAVHYGVPQMRERMFLIAISKSIADTVRLPLPTHWMDLPRGYLDARKMALQTVEERDKTYFERITFPEITGLKKSVSVKDALDDLPILREHLLREKRGGGGTRVPELHYREVPCSDFANVMRNWRGKHSDRVSSHVIRKQPRDFPIFKLMQPGDEYPEAHAVAQVLLRRKLQSHARKHGKAPSPTSKLYKEILKATVPPYDVSKFPNKWRKMEPDAPARTLMAHLGKDCYSHIHYDSDQARTISVREAARLQSFPDGFMFAGPMGAAFRQIGNAVPPLMARAIGEVLVGQLKGKPCL